MDLKPAVAMSVVSFMLARSGIFFTRLL